MTKYIYAFATGFALTGAAVATYRLTTTPVQRGSHLNKARHAITGAISAVKGYLKGLFNGSGAEAAAA